MRLLPEFNATSESFSELLTFGENLSEKVYTLSDLGIPSRIFNYWKTEGVLPRFEPDKTAKFDVVEAVWLLMLNDLRTLGLSISLLKQIGDAIYFKPYREDFGIKFTEAEIKRLESIPSHDTKAAKALKSNLKLDGFREIIRRETTPFDIIIRRFIKFRTESGIAVILKYNTPEGEKEELVANVQYYGEPSMEKGLTELLLSNTYIHLPLKKYIKTLFQCNDEKFINYSPFLRDDERRVLNDIRQGLGEGLAVHFKNKAVKKYEVLSNRKMGLKQFIDFFFSDEGKNIKNYTIVKRKTEVEIYVEEYKRIK